MPPTATMAAATCLNQVWMMFRTMSLGSGSVAVGLRSLSHAAAGLTAKPLSVLPRSSLQPLLTVDAQEAARRIDALVKKSYVFSRQCIACPNACYCLASSSARPFLLFGPRMGYSVKSLGAMLLLALEHRRADEEEFQPPSMESMSDRAKDLTNGLCQAIGYVFENRRQPDVLCPISMQFECS